VSFNARLFRLHAGFVVIAVAVALNVRSRLGLGPLFVVYDGLHRHGIPTIGTAGIITNAALFCAALVLRQRPGLGTIGQVLLVGPLIDLALMVIPRVHGWPLETAYIITSLVVMSFGAALYLSAQLGAGPYDAVMWGVYHHAHRWPLLVIRLAMECTALVTGWLLGGAVGVGTVIIGLGIGPGMAFWLRVLRAMPERVAPAAVLVGATDDVDADALAG
jgi:uncharacterized membrane protein YczE